MYDDDDDDAEQCSSNVYLKRNHRHLIGYYSAARCVSNTFYFAVKLF